MVTYPKPSPAEFIIQATYIRIELELDAINHRKVIAPSHINQSRHQRSLTGPYTARDCVSVFSWYDAVNLLIQIAYPDAELKALQT